MENCQNTSCQNLIKSNQFHLLQPFVTIYIYFFSISNFFSSHIVRSWSCTAIRKMSQKEHWCYGRTGWIIHALLACSYFYFMSTLNNVPHLKPKCTQCWIFIDTGVSRVYMVHAYIYIFCKTKITVVFVRFISTMHSWWLILTYLLEIS